MNEELWEQILFYLSTYLPAIVTLIASIVLPIITLRRALSGHKDTKTALLKNNQVTNTMADDAKNTRIMTAVTLENVQNFQKQVSLLDQTIRSMQMKMDELKGDIASFKAKAAKQMKETTELVSWIKGDEKK